MRSKNLMQSTSISRLLGAFVVTIVCATTASDAQTVSQSASSPAASSPEGNAIANDFFKDKNIVGPVLPLYWTKLNDGGFVDAGEELGGTGYFSYFSSIVTDDGDLLYQFRSATVGTAMGRLSSAKNWELFTDGAWSSDSSTTATAVDHAFGLYGDKKLLQHPDISNGLLGYAFGGIRSGTAAFNQHGVAVSFRFDGTTFTQYANNANYDEFRSKSVISSWPGIQADFDFDPVARTGILIGNVGQANFQSDEFLTASQYRHDDMSHTWRRWNRPETGDPDWGANNSPDSMRSSLIFDNDMDWFAYQQDFPQITHIPGTSDYFITFTMSGLNAGSNGLMAGRYTPGTPNTWNWWDGNAFQNGEPFDFTPILPDTAYSYSIRDRDQFHWRDGLVEILFKSGADLHEIVFDTVLNTFTNNGVVVSDVGDYRVGKTSAGAIEIYFSNDGDTIKRARKSPAGTWSLPATVFVNNDESIQPVGVSYYANRPVVFLSVVIGGGSRLCAISPLSRFWNDEGTIQLDPLPEIQVLDPNELQHEKTVTNDAPGNTYGGGRPGSMGVDSDGYIYTGRYGNTAVIVHPPHSMGVEDNAAWGAHWDYFDFPGGADVDSLRGKVYVTDMMIGGQNGLVSYSAVQIWETSLREVSFGYQGSPGGGSSPPPEFDRSLYGQSIGGHSWAADVAVDSEAGLLYVTDSLNHRVKVYDIENLVDTGNSFDRVGLFEYRIIEDHKPYVQDLVTRLVDAGMLSDNGTDLTWVSQDLEGEVVPFLIVQPEFALLDSSYDDQEFLRNVRKHYKERNDRPVFLTSFGSLGVGAGEMRFPQGIDLDNNGNVYVVDCENNRVQFWKNNGDGTYSNELTFGSLGRGPGELFYPVGLAVDNAYGQIHVTDPLNKRIQVFDMLGGFQYEWGAFDTGVLNYLNNSMGIESDQRGALHVGVGSSVVTFRTEDERPRIKLGEPDPCDELGTGINGFSGEVRDDYGIDRIELLITAGGQTIVSESYLVGIGTFNLTYEIPTNIPAGTDARFEARAFDTIGQTDAVVFFVRIGGPGDPTDSDGDGLPDGCDNCPLHANPNQADCDDDGVGDVCTIANGLDTDCNANGIPDGCDLLFGESLDCNTNQLPDECDVDCNGNGIPDECDIANGFSVDCNGNQIPDICDIDGGDSTDCDGSGIPDECELDVFDCNSNGIHDACDILSGVSKDCQPNGTPDECELDSAWSLLGQSSDGLLYSMIRDQNNGDVIVASIANGAELVRLNNTGGFDQFSDIPSIIFSLGIVQDPAVGDYLVSGLGSGFLGTIVRVGLDGQETPFASFGSGEYMAGMAFDGNGDLIVCSAMTQELLRIDGAGVVTTFASGSPLAGPFGLTRDPTTGDFYVADSAGVIRIDTAGNLSIVDTGGMTGFVSIAMALDGGAIYAGRFDSPFVIEILLDGTITPIITSQTSVAIYGLVSEDQGGRFLTSGIFDGTGKVYSVIVENDCNSNGVPDDCDLADGTLTDMNGDGIPDQCQDVGGCCVDGLCEIRTAESCAALCGYYFGTGSDCMTIACPFPIPGACCIDGVCDDDIPGSNSCDCAGGTWEINWNGTGCAEINCTP